MYIQIKNDPEAPVLMSRKLCKSLGFDKGNHYFLAMTGLRIVTGKILRVKELNVNGNKYYEICND